MRLGTRARTRRAGAATVAATTSVVSTPGVGDAGRAGGGPAAGRSR